MSKIMNDLNRLSQKRSADDNIVVDEPADTREPAKEARDHKGVYVLSALVLVLIILGALLMSAGLKIFAQLEEVAGDSGAIQQALQVQANELQGLKDLVVNKEKEQAKQITGLNNQLSSLESAVQEGADKLSGFSAEYREFRSSTDASIKGLKASGNRMTDQYKRIKDKTEELNTKIQQFEENNSWLLNSN